MKPHLKFNSFSLQILAIYESIFEFFYMSKRNRNQNILEMLQFQIFNKLKQILVSKN